MVNTVISRARLHGPHTAGIDTVSVLFAMLLSSQDF